jgi:hypothetical protein
VFRKESVLIPGRIVLLLAFLNKRRKNALRAGNSSSKNNLNCPKMVQILFLSGYELLKNVALKLS